MASNSGVLTENSRSIQVRPRWFFFTRRYKAEKLQTIKFFNKTLAVSNQVKYLGVILDANLAADSKLKLSARKH